MPGRLEDLTVEVTVVAGAATVDFTCQVKAKAVVGPAGSDVPGWATKRAVS